MSAENGIPEKGSLLDDINEFGRLINDLAVSMGKEPTCKPITLSPITVKVAKLEGYAAEKANAPLPEILTCPFCGDNAHSVSYSEADWYVTCNGERDEECQGIRDEPMGYLTERFAIEAWNKRFTREQE